MRSTAATALLGSRLVLVPYRLHHVPKYHAWMQDEQLRELTGSELLSTEEEVDMCRSWASDEDKATFILLDIDILRKRFAIDEEAAQGAPRSADAAAAVFARLSESDAATRHAAEVDAMVGDVNFFLHPGWEGGEVGEDGEEDEREGAEMEIMIAEPAARRKGFASEAVRMMMLFGVRGMLRAEGESRVQLRRFRVKIGDANVASLALFRERLGFALHSHSDFFNETELVRRVDDETVAAWTQATGLTFQTYPDDL